MRRVLTWFLGIRFDLDLENRWWHRLFKVIFLLLFPVLAAAAWVLAKPSPSAHNTVIIDNLKDFTTRATTDAENTIPGFTALKGELGIRSRSGAIQLLTAHELERGMCSKQQARPFLPNVRPLTPEEQRRSGRFKEIGRYIPNERDADVLQGGCWVPAELSVDSVDSIAKWRYAADRVALQRVRTTATLIGIVVLIAFNVYYRGLIYITFGPTKR